MADYEYITITAPRRPKKAKGVKGKEEQIAHAIGEIIREQAALGWEYARTDHFPMEEGGFLAKKSVTNHAVMVFRKERASQAATPRPRPVSAPSQPAALAEPEPSDDRADEDTPMIGGVQRD